jgi:hypothetical protein
MNKKNEFSNNLLINIELEKISIFILILFIFN